MRNIVQILFLESYFLAIVFSLAQVHSENRALSQEILHAILRVG